MILLNLLIHISYCTVIGIDLGSDSLKIAIGSRNKGVHRVRNYYKNDATPNVFSYLDNSNWAFGEGAIAQCRVDPDTCIQNQRLPLNSEFYFKDSLRGYEITSLALKQIVKNVVNKLNISYTNLNVVVAVPPSITNREKNFLYASLSTSDINCIQFVTSTYASIETYVNQHKDNNVNTGVIIDMGHEGIRLSGFEFDNTQITQKLHLFNDDLGGKKIDENLMKLIIDRYTLVLSNPSYSSDPNYDYTYEYKKNRYLLLTKIKRAREELSSKEEVNFEFKSTNITISIDDVEFCCHEIKEALNKMITVLLSNKYQYLLNSGEVQIVGRLSRTPYLQSYLSKLLPNIRISQKMSKTLSASKGACYVIDSESGTSIQEHNSLFSSKVLFKTPDNDYNLFIYENYENFNPIVKLSNVKSEQIFTVIDETAHGQAFSQFTINVPSNYNGKNKIELGFTLNYYLMPYPDAPKLISPTDDTLSVSFQKVGYEIPPDVLATSKKTVRYMLNYLNKELEVNVISQELEEYKNFIQEKLKNYFFMNWRRISYQAIVATANYKYNSCLKENDYECPESRMKEILDDFRSSVSYLKIKGIDEYDDNYFKDQRKVALDNLNGLIHTCRHVNAKYDDVEKWMNNNMQYSSINDIKKQIVVLRERVMNAEMARHDEL